MNKSISIINKLKYVLKRKNNNLNPSSVFKNFKMQHIYSNEKINKKEHYIYFREHDIKKDFDYTHVIKTRNLFKSRSQYKHAFLFISMGSIVTIILSVFFLTSKWNNNNYY
ncbi:conserved Plasmodium protein, unknown function [Plasmodium reichenowi]|uniref:Uncharacterized protein n=15 Tax=Plasmodium (Laverania) TaxID=418107 RepID=Q8IKP9_PLAF7|nr:conserved Plasmodium protein, unknown function [Plasmodium falciparum 3D7]XP_012765625.1 hypothetical protein PRSY57_1457500 [Plasmodium reichenowi]ETW15883.1 hypothetical protein PFFVO_05214 [Plasmodium falciparum Vietnam Oak-Knoll (FVO)]ETW28985.1 hypothetical protein PFFCH_03601 [Plasmodium falciparum FCH/4]ETW33699.1 hypothetical protein PFTANZ_05562 [Plasmodium falciparum Tanzania (2000708)]ETW39668.1 hypothetical protein PFNF135_05697 [Plasmodium falciparum NF135/5.C10]ETW46516.1 hyp|eukprot:XP_001348729.1 conserved Plasmodium protein, unknown function [Plasmodium falciparum 3D7]